MEDVANFAGEQYKTTWNKENGFEGFVRGTLYNWVYFLPKGEVTILD